MKHKKQNESANEGNSFEISRVSIFIVFFLLGNTSMDTTGEVPASVSTVVLTDADRENGNFKNFGISKKLVKKLKGITNTSYRYR